MCGITGISNQSIDKTSIEKMSSSLAHRGPDDSGTQVWPDHNVAFGHRRLSIIDLSSAGRNPLSNEDGTIWITFNGEIYNYKVLRRELEKLNHEFSSNSDAEVIVHAYEEWGDDHVKQLRGMFAYALYDRRRQSYSNNIGKENAFRILLIRDRFGIKPLFYYWHKGTFLFASEIKALLEYPGIDKSIDEGAIFDYPTYGYIPTPKTIYTHIRKLAPGYILSFENGQVKINQYWDVSFNRSNPVRSLADAIEQARNVVTEAVSISLASDVPLGVLLSGGIDSSSITALMSKSTQRKFHTFSMGFDVAEHSETRYARLVADRYQTLHHEKSVGFDSLSKILPIVMKLYDEPYADSSTIPTYYLCQLARQYVKAVLSGDGGDEAFGGYNWYSSWLKQSFFNKIPFPLWKLSARYLDAVWPENWDSKKVISQLTMRRLENYAGLIELFSPSEKKKIFKPSFVRKFKDYDHYWYFRKFWQPELDPLTRVQYLDSKTYLCDDILTKVDRCGMAVSLEVRPPLLDHHLVELFFSLPVKFRAPDGKQKYLYKEAVKDLIPEPIMNRPKKGFSVPWNKWVGDNQEWFKNQFYQDNLPEVFSPNVSELFNSYKKGIKPWALLVLKEWLAHNI